MNLISLFDLTDDDKLEIAILAQTSRLEAISLMRGKCRETFSIAIWNQYLENICIECDSPLKPLGVYE